MDIKVHKTDLPEDLNVGNRVAVDCEFMGLNFQRDKLCLVQISSGNSDAHIVQLDRVEYKAPVLKRILSDKSIKKIFHFARADLTFIKKYLLIDVNNIEDTKLQSKLARSYTDKHGLKDLIKEQARKVDWYAYFQKQLDFIEQNNVHISKKDKAKLIEQRDSCKKPQVKCI